MNTNNPLKTTALIVNYNYGDYVSEAIQSVLQQSIPIDQLIVVDDGSTDHSRDVIKQLLGDRSDTKILFKDNEGQSAAYQSAAPHITGDIIFFLDSDDRWKKNHVESLLSAFHLYNEVDFVYCGHERFGDRHDPWQPYLHPHYLGMSPIAAIYNNAFLGTTPSATAIRTALFSRIYPLDSTTLIKKEYPTDSILARAASILGGIKYFQHPPTIEYRIHTKNKSRIDQSKTFKYYRHLKIGHIINHFTAKVEFSPLCPKKYHMEFMTIPTPTKLDYKDARKTLQQLKLPISLHINTHIKLLRHYIKNRRPTGR